MVLLFKHDLCRMGIFLPLTLAWLSAAVVKTTAAWLKQKLNQ